MAYVNKELKAKAAAGLKKALAGTKIKYSLAVKHGSELAITIQACEVDFITNYNELIQKKNRTSWGSPITPAEDYIQVNEYWFHEHFDGKALELLEIIKKELLTDEFYNNDDAQTDYFDRSHYISINIGKYDKPFTVLGA